MSSNSKIIRNRGEKEWRKIIGHHIRYFRQASGHSLQDIANILDVSYQQVQKYEQGLNRIPIEKLYQLRVFYDVSIEMFLRDLPLAGSHLDREKTLFKNPDFYIYLKLRQVKDKRLKQKIAKMILILIDEEGL